MIVLDASVLIAQLNARDIHHATAKQLLIDAAAEPLGAATITLAEVLVAPAAAGRLGDAAAALTALRVAELPMGSGAAAALAELRASTRLKLPDCCVLLAARDHAAAVATFDERLGAAARDLAIATLRPPPA